MISVRIFNTPVKIKWAVLPIPIVVWAGVTLVGLYFHPERGFCQGLLIGFATAILLLGVDFGHALAHIFSARYAGAPMDEILISGEMPRTLYFNNDVTPKTHRMRALGGPIFNLVGLLLSLLIFALIPGIPLVRELMTWTAAGHGIQFLMSLVPLPIVDGGTILKWTLVARGKTEQEANNIVTRVDWVLASIFGLTAVILLFMKLWLVGLIFLGLSAIIIAITAGKIR